MFSILKAGKACSKETCVIFFNPVISQTYLTTETVSHVMSLIVLDKRDSPAGAGDNSHCPLERAGRDPGKGGDIFRAFLTSKPLPGRLSSAQSGP